MKTSIWIFALILLTLPFQTLANETALSMHGDALYGRNFQHFKYSNPNAHKGGNVRIPIVGSFDSLQPFLIKGVAAAGLGFVYQSLMERSKDEPFSLYSSVAKSYVMAKDRRWITFQIDDTAHFSNGAPITAEDILFSYETLRAKGRPNHRQYYAQAEKVTILHSHQIRFDFKADSGHEIPLIFALMPVLSKDYFSTVPFEQAGLDVPIGSGPYKVKKIDPGRMIIYERDENFWAKNKAPFVGRYNFSQIQYEYFRDTDIAFEALKAEQIDVFFENNPGKWKNKIALNNERLLSKTVDLRLPPPFLGLVFNTRKANFSNILTRQALTLAYDFEWINSNLFHGLYKRTTSYFGAGNLQATHVPTNAEKEILAPFENELARHIFEQEFKLPTSDGSGRIRKRLKQAQQLLEQAGFYLQNGHLHHMESNERFEIEIIIADKSHIKMLGSFQKNLRKLGITLSIRLLDSASHQNRINNYDFDMMIAEWGQSLSPGNEQLFYWHSEAAHTPGSRNYPGIQNKAIDHISQLIATTKERSVLEAAVRALDRLLLWGYYAIPLHHSNQQWIYHNSRIKIPKQATNYGTSADLWWAATVDAATGKRH